MIIAAREVERGREVMFCGGEEEGADVDLPCSKDGAICFGHEDSEIDGVAVEQSSGNGFLFGRVEIEPSGAGSVGEFTGGVTVNDEVVLERSVAFKEPVTNPSPVGMGFARGSWKREFGRHEEFGGLAGGLASLDARVNEQNVAAL